MKAFIRKIPFLHSVARQSRAAYGRYRLSKVRRLRPLKLVVGASGVCERDWVATDVQYLNLLKPEQWDRYFDRNSVSAILAEHVWEHLDVEDGRKAAQCCFEFLSPGGYLRVAVPDGFHPDPEYIGSVKPGGTGIGSDDHKVLYTIDILTSVFESVGFRVEPLEYFDAKAEFHYSDWSPAQGMVYRSRRFDKRNCDPHLKYTSLILDVIKVGGDV